MFIDTDILFIRELAKTTMKEIDSLCGLKFKFVSEEENFDMRYNYQFNPDAGTHCLVGIGNKIFLPRSKTLCVIGSPAQIYYQEIAIAKRDIENATISNNPTAVKFYEDFIEERKALARANIIHEVFHKLGALHEQDHPDSGISWKVEDGVRESYKSYPYLHSKYDPTSIMHYPSQQYEHLTMGEVAEIPYILDMSKGDKKWLVDIYGSPKGKWDRGVQEHLLDVPVPMV